MSKKDAPSPESSRPALEVVYRDISSIMMDPKNARKHSKAQIQTLCASYEEFGFTNPILLRPSGMIGAGHGRFEMAKLKGLTKVPTITLHLTEEQWRVYAIADNAIPLGATWDMDQLRMEMAEIDPVDITALGLAPLVADPPEVAARGTRVNQTVIQFNIIFDNVEQQGAWHEFVRKLKADPEYGELETLGGRLAKFLETAKV